jgi:3-phenylpropionate/trans-cinnamate dioxygenase ferredoxin reductase subunit
MVGGHVGEEPVLLARRGNEFLAIGSTCSHYGGLLAEGLLVGDTVRCPWHHARFSLRSGEATGAPALNPVPCWRVEQRDGKVVVREKIAPAGRHPSRTARQSSEKSERAVIVGGGAAGFAAAEMLRREGFAGSVTLLLPDHGRLCSRGEIASTPVRSRRSLAAKARVPMSCHLGWCQ